MIQSFTSKPLKQQAVFKTILGATAASMALASVCAIAEPQPMTRNKITGENNCISLDFKDLPVMDAFRVYFDAVHENFVLDKTISGAVELKLDCVAAKDVLNALVTVANTVMVQKVDGISYVTPKRNGVTTETTVLKASASSLPSEPTKTDPDKDKPKIPEATKLVKVYNATAGEMINLISNSANPDLLMKPFDADNSVYLAGRKDWVEQAEQAIALIDKPKRQFMIAAKLMATSDNFLENLGTSFNAAVNEGQYSSSAASTFTSLGAASGGSSLIFQKAGNIILNAKISAAISDGEASVISEPRTIAYENKSSSITQGLRIPYQTQLPLGGFQVSFVDAALSLQVTPRLGDNNGRIIIDIYFSKNSAGAPSTAGISIETREIRTTVAMKSGETVVMGGIDETNATNSESGVPVLRDIPYLGYVFGATSDSKSHNKIVLMLTPTLL